MIQPEDSRTAVTEPKFQSQHNFRNNMLNPESGSHCSKSMYLGSLCMFKYLVRLGHLWGLFAYTSLIQTIIFPHTHVILLQNSLETGRRKKPA